MPPPWTYLWPICPNILERKKPICTTGPRDSRLGQHWGSDVNNDNPTKMVDFKVHHWILCHWKKDETNLPMRLSSLPHMQRRPQNHCSYSTMPTIVFTRVMGPGNKELPINAKGIRHTPWHIGRYELRHSCMAFTVDPTNHANDSRTTANHTVLEQLCPWLPSPLLVDDTNALLQHKKIPEVISQMDLNCTTKNTQNSTQTTMGPPEQSTTQNEHPTSPWRLC